MVQFQKKNFIKKPYVGDTEYLAKKTPVNKCAMVIFNKKIAVCPIVTHEPLKYVSRKINKIKIIRKILLINKFWQINLNTNAKFAITGLNPHCESVDEFNEDKKLFYQLLKI